MENHLLSMKHRLLNTAILSGMLLIYPVMISSLVRAYDIGWHNIFFYHIVVATGTTLLYFLRKRVSLNIKIHAYAFIFSSLNLVGLLSFGLVSGISFFLLTVLVVTIITDKKTGTIYAASFIGLFVILSVIFASQLYTVTIDLKQYNTLPSTWIMTLLALAYIIIIIINTVGEYNVFFMNNINHLNKNIIALTQVQFELRSAKDKAEEREKQLRQISDNFENGMIYQVVATDENNRKFTYLSESAQKYYGCSVAEAKENASLIYGQIFEEDRALLSELEKESLKNLTVFKAKVRSYKPDGSLRWVYLVSKPRPVNGTIVWDGVEFDITDLKYTQEALEKSENLHRSLFENMSSGFVLFEIFKNEQSQDDFRMLQANMEYERLTGMSRINEFDKTSENFFSKFPKELIQKFFNVASTGNTIQYERFNPELNKHLEIRAFSPIQGLVAILFNDITERKSNENRIQKMIQELEDSNIKLKESEEKFNKAFNNSSVAMTISSIEDSIYIEANKEFCRLVEWDYDDIIGHSFTELNLWQDINKRDILVNEVLRSGSLQNIEIDIFTKSKQKKTLLISVDTIAVKNQTRLLISAFDITKLKNAEKALKNNEEHLQLLLDSITDYIYSTKIKNGQVIETEYSEGCKSITGYTSREFKENGELWINIVYDEDRENVLKQADNIMLKLKADPLEHRIITKGGEVKWVRNEPVLRYNFRNELDGYDGIIIDITERKVLEQQMLNGVIETEERERMNFSQELHDGLGPLISAIKMYIQLLSLPGTDLKPQAVIGDMEKLIEESSRTIREISFKLSPHILQNYGIVEAISAFIGKVKESKKIEIIFNHSKIHRFSSLIETIIYRVLCECINNTVKHAKASRIEINIEHTDSTLEIHYTDNGKGFDVEKVMNSRKGIGLLNIQSRVKSINGKVIINSAPTKGTTIILKIKLANTRN